MISSDSYYVISIFSLGDPYYRESYFYNGLYFSQEEYSYHKASLPNRSQELSILLSVFSKSVRATSDLFDVINHGSNDNAG